MSELERAEILARVAHQHQREESTGDPYILHVRRVVDFVVTDEEKAVAWLHDVIEDSNLTLYDLRENGISESVVEAVDLLTHVKPTTYADYIKRIAESGNDLALTVKLADLNDHLRPNCPERLRPRYEAALARLISAALDSERRSASP